MRFFFFGNHDNQDNALSMLGGMDTAKDGRIPLPFPYDPVNDSGNYNGGGNADKLPSGLPRNFSLSDMVNFS